MKLNPDSVRIVLLYLEENQKIDENLYSGKVINNILEIYDSKYGFYDDILYAIKQLSDNGMIDAQIIAPNGNYINHYRIKDITPKGHEILNNIREDNNWELIKQYAKKAGSFALSILNQSAASIISSKLVGL